MIKLILNSHGIDKSGLVNKISGIVYSLNGNILESKMVRLENIFSIIMAIEIHENNKLELKNKINSITSLNSTIKTLDEFNLNENDIKYVFTLECLDNEGIINHFTNYFNENNINIEEMNTTITYAPTTGSLIFNLDSIIAVPKKIKFEKLDIKLDLLSEKFNVNYNLLLLKSK